MTAPAFIIDTIAINGSPIQAFKIALGPPVSNGWEPSAEYVFWKDVPLCVPFVHAWRKVLRRDSGHHLPRRLRRKPAHA